MPPVAPSRRRFLAGVAALPLIGATPAFAGDQPAPGVGRARAPVLARVLAMSDLHSAYERSAQVLAALRAEVRRQSVPHLIALDGDIFEHGNVVSVRSQGAIDWAFLAALPSIAPTVVNLGNHDNDLTPDLHAVVARMQGLGISVISNIIDARTGQPYARAATEIALGQRRLRIIGFGTNSLNTYPKDSRDWLSIPDPTDWARAHLPPLLNGADLTLVMSHAGVAGDRGMLSALPDGALMIGGHNHLLFQEPLGRGLYAHTGSWNNAYTAADYLSDGSVRAQSRSVALDGPADPALAALIRATLAQHLSAQERAVLGSSPAALSLGDTGRAVAAAFARFAGAQAGFIYRPYDSGDGPARRADQPLRLRRRGAVRRQADGRRGSGRASQRADRPGQSGPRHALRPTHRRLRLWRGPGRREARYDPHRHHRLVRPEPAGVFRRRRSGFHRGPRPRRQGRRGAGPAAGLSIIPERQAARR